MRSTRSAASLSSHVPSSSPALALLRRARTQRPTTNAAGFGGGRAQTLRRAAERDRPNQQGELAPRLQNVGKYVFPVTTKNARAQLFINQGVNLSYAFNHAEAGRAFREAARLDPSLAMAYWGLALVLGPNINAAMDAADETPAYDGHQEGARAQAASRPCASGRTSTRWRSATTASPKIGSRATTRTRTRCRRCSRTSPPTWTPPCSTSSP